ncbi:MAG: UbiA family prenyltransferase [Chloroflexi bacterium]|jgi:1,4-dihydroxy-2-naphthoate octaprenyltransferase|nr:UbiA family prenyltransferase [Anaerolineaceae bacterium]NMB87244.1 UbiA family prenyltransferase [Chloroflexota bacterium]
MENQNSNLLTYFVRILRPGTLLAGILLYTLGVGIANYLGETINWSVFGTGLSLVLILLVSCFLLKALYDLPAADPSRSQHKARESSTGPEVPENLTRTTLLPVAFSALTVGAVLTVILYSQGAVTPPTMVILGAAFVAAMIYAIPPYRLVYSGYGELIEAILLASFIPALAYSFQSGELHRLLAMLTFPLMALYLAMRLAGSLPGYMQDIKDERSTLMVRLGWQRGMNLHNLLILFAYLLLGLAAVLGLPWSLTWPGLLTLPLGIFQIWQMAQISAGASPRWRVLTLTALAVFGFTAYLLAFALWTG